MRIQRPILVYAMIGLHFGLLLLGILRVSLPTRLGRSLQLGYARITGAGGSFGFFSPNVPRGTDISFAVELESGQVIQTALQDSIALEVRARLSNMLHLLEKHYENGKVVRSIAASLTAAVYRRYPDAKTITISANFIQFPSMQQYQQGKKTEWKPIYSAKFRLKSEPDHAP